jgi:DNA-binding beta-propeller fold protein YncE
MAFQGQWVVSNLDCFAISPDGMHVATASFNEDSLRRRLMLWSIATMTEAVVLEDRTSRHILPIPRMLFNSAGDRIAVTTVDSDLGSIIELWDVAKAVSLFRHAFECNCTSVRFLNNDCLAACLTSTYDASTEVRVLCSNRRDTVMCNLDLPRDKARLPSSVTTEFGTQDNLVAVTVAEVYMIFVSLFRYHPEATDATTANPPCCSAFVSTDSYYINIRMKFNTSDSLLVITTGSDLPSEVFVLETASGTVVHTLQTRYKVVGLEFLPNANSVVVAHYGSMKVIDLDTFKETVYEPTDSLITGIAAAPSSVILM